MKLSFSKLTMLWRCGEQYRRRYVKSEIIPPGVSLIVGSATHDSIERNLTHKILTNGKLLADTDIKDIARDSVVGKFGGEVKLTEEETGQGLGKVKGVAIDTAVSLSLLHHKQLAPEILPKTVEEKFEIKIKNTEHVIDGRIDIVEETKSIRDTKTTSKAMPDSAEKSLQLTVYGLAKQAQGEPIETYYIDQLVKTKEPKIVTLQTTRSKDDFEMLLRRIANGLEQIEAGIFPPCNPDNWWCNKKWCGYYETCPYQVNKEII